MKVKKILILCFVLFVYNSYAQREYETFHHITDSLIMQFKSEIITDLENNDINIPEQIKQIKSPLGKSFILRVNIGYKYPQRRIRAKNITPPKERPKSKGRQKHFYIMNYIDQTGQIPYDRIESFIYEFITFRQEDAVYGRYEFKISSEQIIILDKNVEVLKKQDDIVNSIRTHFVQDLDFFNK